MIEYTYQVGDTDTVTVIASNREEAFYKAEQEASAMGLHDAPLSLVDEQEYDPSGGDDDED